MITATVETVHGGTHELQFADGVSYQEFNLYRYLHPESRRLVHGWDRSIRLCDITRVISVEEEN
ncbi:hypothetical protein COF71_13735 [Bacillus toyonensis]|nr:hypothetical protein COM61_22640 [Bacillus toyonensis]PHE47012.1 hypothetical protein COF71_13735 [Bacillus toyonensis]